jgi:dTDP-4-amino-4,6-dideoxygalactose transaminase
LHVGYIREHVFGVEGAAKDPEFQYVRDAMWFQWQQMLLQKQQMDQQAQMQQAQAQQAPMTQPQQPGTPQQQPANEQPQDLSTGIDQASESLTKGELQLPTSKRLLVAEQKKVIQHFMDGWENDKKEILAGITKATKPYLPKKKK